MAVRKTKTPSGETLTEEQVTTESTCIDEEAWTVRDVNTTVMNRPQDWTTQDYIDNPPEQVTWERPFDAI